jgi:predicted kinase
MLPRTKENTLNHQNKTPQPTLTMTQGLPASGKSTWAVAQVKASTAGSVVRISKDLLRSMLHADTRGPGTERQVLDARDALISVYLRNGVSVIIDDTNFLPYHEQELRKLAQRSGAAFVIQDFTDVPLDECLRRNRLRDSPVPDSAIIEMHDKYLSSQVAS